MKNITAWIAALGPPLSGLVVLLISAMLGWHLENVNIFGWMQLFIFRISLMYVFLRMDYVAIQSQGFNPVKLGIVSPQQGPYYLFSRAKAFRQGRAYAITWCALFVIDVVYPFL